MTNYPETYGWDTVFAISIDRVNNALATVPESSRFSVTTPITGGTATLNWTLLNWRITDTPGGNSLVLTMDFGTASELTSTAGGTPRNVSLNGWTCTVTVRAHFDEIDPVTRKLRARTAHNEKWADVTVNGGTPPPTFADLATVQAIVDGWFGTEDAVLLFEQEFATVNVGASVGSGALDWLAPRTLGFAGATMADNVTKALGILAMTTDKSPASATLMLSPYAMLPNAKAGFIVSRELVMRRMILPACRSAFSTDGVGSDGSFQLSGPGFSQLTNTADLHFTHELDGADRQATLAAGALKLSLEGEVLNLSMAPMNIETSLAGYTIDATIHEQLEMLLIEKPTQPDAKFFALNNVGGRPADVQAVMDPGLKIATAVVTALLAAASLTLAVVSFKGPLMNKMGLSANSAKIWARIISSGFGFVSVLFTIPQWIQLWKEGQTHQIPDFAPVLTAALGGTSWPGGARTTFVAVSGQFANGMLITIDPQFS